MTQARTQTDEEPPRTPRLMPRDASPTDHRSRVISIRPEAGPSNMVDVMIPSGQHTLRITVYRGKAARQVKVGPGERLYCAGGGLVMVLEFPFAGKEDVATESSR